MSPLLFATAMLAIAAPEGAADPAKPADGKERLVCRRETPVGSLIASRKICLTATQWRKRQEDGNASARSMVEEGAGACGQNGGVCPF